MATLRSKIQGQEVSVTSPMRVGTITLKGRVATTGWESYGRIYEMRPVDRVGLIKAGAPASILTKISTDMGVSRNRVVRMIGVAPATANRRVANKKNFSFDESERLVGLTKLIGQVESIVHESGDDTDFQPAMWFSKWIETPVPALGNKRPEEFLDTSDGREAISTLLAQMQSGAYS